MATTILEDPSGYGRVVRDSSGAVERVVETKREGDATDAEREIREINTGIFVFAAGALAAALPQLSDENAQREFYLPQALDLIRASGGTVGAHVVQDERMVLGINDRVALAHVRALAQAAIHERHMLAGVSIVDPAATVIDVDVQIGQDTVIEPFTTIRGSTRIGSGCTIRHSYLVDCVLEDGVSVGPFAYLRPGAVLRDGSKVGTFVEVKNSDIGPGAKVPHLSYIGDADIGERSNLGAATITANYDGRSKHRTTVGSGRAHRRRHHPRRPGERRGRAPTPAPARSSPRTCPPARSGSRAPASATSRATPSAGPGRSEPLRPCVYTSC